MIVSVLVSASDDPPYNWTDSDAELQQQADWERFRGMVNAQRYYSMKVDDVLYCTYWGGKNTEEYGYCHCGG